ncbi:glutaredoxin family protein [Candidatus Woesearchaeota archaeon]|nr:glutaredoxin family protein [Candidatus Woesearchaeota archaeon]
MAKKEATKQKKVIVYSTKTCPYCVMAKEFLKQNKIKFTEKDVSADSAALKEMQEKSGQGGVPVIDINGTIIIGFDLPKLKKELGL